MRPDPVLVDGVQFAPPVDRPESAFFWRSGSDGVLRFLRCEGCAYFIHPPAPYCPRCGSQDAAPAPVTGSATVFSYTVNHQAWVPGTEPYAIAIVVPVEQPDLRLTTRLVECAVDEVHIGMRVEVVFLHVPDMPDGECWLPLFRPQAVS